MESDDEDEMARVNSFQDDEDGVGLQMEEENVAVLAMQSKVLIREDVLKDIHRSLAPLTRSHPEL